MRGILFLSTRNACLGQMAEGFARLLGPPDLGVASAGLSPTSLDENAVRAMAEVGVDIASGRAKGLDEVPSEVFDTVVTLSEEVREVCPVFPRGVRVFHWDFDDPGAQRGRPERVRAAYRNVREHVRARIERFFLHEQLP